MKPLKHVFTLFFIWSLVSPTLAQTTINKRAKFPKRDRERFAQMLANNKKEIKLLIAAAPGHNDAVARQVIAAGGTVLFRDDEVDYLRVKVPVEKAETIAVLGDIVACNLDGSMAYPTLPEEEPANVKGDPDDPKSARPVPPNNRTPGENPYLPTRDMGAPQFIAQHPTWDGRGATIAIFDAGTHDVSVPELQTAKTLDGEPVNKLAGILNAVDPENGAPFRVAMSREVTVGDDLEFKVDDSTYKAARAGNYRFGLFLSENPQRFAMIPSGGKPFAVLLDAVAATVWVDTDQDNTFTDKTPLTDYNVKPSMGVLGKDDPTTPVQESATFVVLIDPKKDSVYLLPELSGHSTGTTAVAAGKGFFGGKMNGAAPEAQIVSIVGWPLSQHGLIHGVILAMKDKRVDLVSIQISSSMTLNDGGSAVSVIWDRLIEKYKKPILISANNYGPGMNTGSEISSGTNVISVGGSVKKETLWSNNGVIAEKEDYLMNLSTRGPRADGGFKPDFVAPLLVVTAFPKNITRPPVSGTYDLPPGYIAAGGTSTSNPMASGGTALLVSAAKQNGIEPTAERLRWALKSSATFLDDYGAYEQGSGLINIPAAWEAFKKAPAPVKITSSAPVSTVLSYQLARPNRGPGIFEREGWRSGQKAERKIIFKRTTGPEGPVKYTLRWVGNDGTFECSERIELPLNMPVDLRVKISPKSPGVHSATLALDDPDGNKAVYQVMNTVVVAEQFTRSNGYTISRKDERVEFPGYVSYFFNVPENADAFKFDLHQQGNGLRVRFFKPSGTDYLITGGGFPFYEPDKKWSRTIADPDPGVWQVVIENSNQAHKGDRSFMTMNNTFSFEASVLGIAVSSAEPVADPAGADYEILAINRFAQFNGGLAGGPLGSAFSERLTLSTGDDPKVYDIDIPEGTLSLNVQTRLAENSLADVDLYLYNCTTGTCVFTAAGNTNHGNERLYAENPAAGKWKVVLDPVAVPKGKTAVVEYADVFTNPAFGVLERTGKTAVHANNEKWTERFTVKPAKPAAETRRFTAAFIRFSGEGVNSVLYGGQRDDNGWLTGIRKPPLPIGWSLVPVNSPKQQIR
jgi:hypothetical protein